MTETRLHTIAALHRGTRERATRQLTDLHRESQKTNLYEGLAKRYTPLDELDVDRPADVDQPVQLRADDVLNDLVETLTTAWDVEATLERTNQEATADIVVDGDLLVAAVPATFLLHLQKQLDNVRTFIDKLPTLPTGETWAYDPVAGYHVTRPVRTGSTRKKPTALVLYPATDKHPAQTQAYNEDVVVGHWETVKRSGALTVAHKRELLRRVNQLQDAVKEARQRANMTAARDLRPARVLFEFLLGDD